MTDGPDGEDAGAGASLAALARRADEQETRIAGLEEREASARKAVKEAARLAATVDQLSAAVTARAGPASEGAAPRPRIWAGLGQDQYLSAARELGRWVTTVLLPTYPDLLGALPYCWPWHARACQELDCLYCGWMAWASPDGAGTARDALEWHDRYLPGTARRLKTHLGECTSRGQHVTEQWTRQVPPDYQDGRNWPELLAIEAAAQAAPGQGGPGGAGP
jgi:hypothetical protein